MAMKMIEVSGSLKDNLDLRIEAAKSPSSNLSWTTGKMVWLKFTSNVVQGAVKPREGVEAVAGKTSHYQSLFGGATTINELYDSAANRLTPAPGLISANIKHTGTLKTLKNIEVNYKCWNLVQLQELEKLFMSLGKTVVLEYGWTIKPDGTRVSQIMTTDHHKLPFDEFLRKASKLADDNDGCYGADKGVVSNFSWTQDADGSYSCTTKFSSPAEMMMSSNSKGVAKNSKCCKTEKQKDGSNCKKDFDVSKKLMQIASGDIIPMGTHREKIFSSGPDLQVIPWGFTMRMDKDQTEEEKADRNWWARNMKRWASSINTPQKFVTWAWFEEEILNDALLPKAPGAKTSDNGGESEDQAPASYRNPDVDSTYRFDCRMTTLANPEYMCSADPTICMLPDQAFWTRKEDFLYGNVERDLKVWDFAHMDGLYHMLPFDASIDYYTGKVVEKRKNLGWLSHICINIRFLQRCVDESETLEALVNKVLDGINQACGNHWHLVISPIPENPALMTVVDVKSLGKHIAPYPISILGNHSILKNVTLNTEVSNEVKAQIMYGSNSKDPGTEGKADDFGLFGRGLSDRTPGWGDMTLETKNQCESDPNSSDTSGEKRIDDVKGERKMVTEQYHKAWQALVGGVDDETISTMKSTIKALQNFSEYEDVVQNSPPLLPVNFSFTLDGIAGFKWGHSLMIDPIPDRYDGCIFMVTGIDHEIGLDSWDTSISTVLRIKPLPQSERVKRIPKPIEKNYESGGYWQTSAVGGRN
jgi:hypothetical protein